MSNKCYFKELSESPSQEGLQYQRRFPEINFTVCRDSCTGHKGYGTCEKFVDNSEEGLAKIVAMQK